MNYREIELTIFNTEELYNMAHQVKDMKLDNNEISNLTSATLRQIAENSGTEQESATDHNKECVRSVVVDVQLGDSDE